MFTRADIALLRAINVSGSEALEPLMLAFSWLGHYWRLPLYAAGLLASALVIRRRGERAGVWPSMMAAGNLVIAFAIAAPLTAALKYAFARPRPAALEGVCVFTAADSAFFFPSGHAVFTGVLVASLWPVLPRWGRFVAVLFALGVAVSRVWLGAHFPSDVGAGLLIGIVVGAWTGWVADRWRADSGAALAFGLATLVLALDAGSKTTIAATVQLGERVHMTESYNVVYWRNTGAAFSFLHDASGWQRVFFILLALAISVWLIQEIRKRDIPLALRLGYGAVLGGALGNMFDRLFRDAVVDWLDFHWAGYSWPAFNAADVAIFLGAIIIVAATFRRAPPEAQPTASRGAGGT